MKKTKQNTSFMEGIGRTVPLTAEERKDQELLEQLKCKVQEEVKESSDAMSAGRQRGSHFRNTFEAMTKAMNSMTNVLDKTLAVSVDAADVQARLTQLDEDRKKGLKITEDEYGRLRMAILTQAYRSHI